MSSTKQVQIFGLALLACVVFLTFTQIQRGDAPLIQTTASPCAPCPTVHIEQPPPSESRSIPVEMPSEPPSESRSIPVEIPPEPTSTPKLKRWIPKSSAKICTYPAAETYAKDMTSQSKEDAQILKLLYGLCGGTYIEMGALDGVLYSNSHVFSKHFDFRGLLVEADPNNFAQLQLHRSKDKELAIVHKAACEKERTLHYMSGGKGNGATSGIWEFMPEDFRKVWWGDKKKEDGTPIECKPLQKIMDDALGKGKHYFDFFSLDIEGAELEALRSLDFSRTAFGIVLVEADRLNERKDLAVKTILGQHGYVLFIDDARNFWFYNELWHEIYKDLLYMEK